MIDIAAAIREHEAMILGLQSLTAIIQRIGERMVATLQNGGKILWLGNGGSAADCQHIAAELVGRFTRERRGLAAIALTTDTSILTAIANDYGFEHLFSRQIEALCQPQDLVVGISTSGNSPNIIHGLDKARSQGATTVAMTGGTGGRMITSVDDYIIIPATTTARIQEGHILVGHILCDYIEDAFMK